MHRSVPVDTLIGNKAEELRATPGVRKWLERFLLPRCREECRDALGEIGRFPERVARWSSRDAAFLTLVVFDWDAYDLETRAATAVLLHRLRSELAATIRRSTNAALASAWDRAANQTNLFGEDA